METVGSIALVTDPHLSSSSFPATLKEILAFFAAIPKVRLDTVHVCGVDEMSTQDIFAYFKEYPPAHIEWLDDTSCKYSDGLTPFRRILAIQRDGVGILVEQCEEVPEGFLLVYFQCQAWRLWL